MNDIEIAKIDESPDERKWDKKTRARGKRYRNESEGFVCAFCKCGFSEGEPYGMQTMCGSFGSILTYWHSTKNHCITALTERVRELEKKLAGFVLLDREEFGS